MLFENFLDSNEEYQACELFWENLVRNIAQSLSQDNEWLRWMPRCYANGTPFELDGNPIFDGRSNSLNRAFRIIQHRSTGSDELEISAWITSWEAEYADLPRDELFINLSLSRESEQVASDLLRKWMTPTTTKDVMKEYISKHGLR